MLKQKDKVSIAITYELSKVDFDVLTMLYCPLIGERALHLYMILHSLANHNQIFENHSIILEVSGFSIEVIEVERKTLERYQLLKTYYDVKQNQYLYQMKQPLPAKMFLRHEVFGRLYLNKMGSQVVKFQKLLFIQNEVDLHIYQDISECIQDVIQEDWNEDFESMYQQVKHNISKKEEIIFNYDEFLNGLGSVVWPKANRNKASLEAIGQIATVYGISPKQMRVLVSRSITQGVLNIDVLRQKAVVSKAQYETSETNIYKWPPMRFMQQKQNGIPLSKQDKETIRILLEEFRLAPEVCNVLIEYVLKISDQKFIRSFVESVAASWVRANVDTFEKAQLRVNQQSTNVIPKEERKEDTISESDRLKLLEEIKKMRGA